MYTLIYKTTYFFKTKTSFLKTIKLLTQNLKKSVTLQKKSGQLCRFCQVMLVTEKKPAYYRLSNQVLLHPKLES